MSNIDAKLVYTDPNIDHKFTVELDKSDIRRLISGYKNRIDLGYLPRRIKEYKYGLMIDRIPEDESYRKRDLYKMVEVPFQRHMRNHWNYKVKNGYYNESTGKIETKQFRNWFRYKQYYLESMEAYYESMIKKIVHFSALIDYDCSEIVEEINSSDKLQRSRDNYWKEKAANAPDGWED